MTICLITRWPRRLMVALLLVASVGCERSARSLALDQPRAREACTTFLTAWKDGKSSLDLEPEIVGSDHDWESRKKLVSFELLSNETSDGTNLHIPVRLKLQDSTGRESQADAIYVVGTSPVVTVIRDAPE